MAKERKKVERKPIAVVKPKQREVQSTTSIIKEPVETMVSDNSEITKLNLKFVKLCDGAKQEEAKEIGDRVQRGELKWSHFSVDGNKNCHHYLIIKKL